MLFVPIVLLTDRAGWPQLLLSCVAGLLAVAWAWYRYGKDYARFM